MTRKVSNLILCGLSALAISASHAAAQDADGTNATQAPTSPTTVQRVAPPPADKAEVVFFRPWAYPGMAVSFSVHDGQTGVAKLGVNNYVVYVTDPGDHTFTVQSEATDSLHMELDQGEIYYVKETLGMGVILYRPHLTPSDEATFDAIKSMKLSKQKPTDLKPTDQKSNDTNSVDGPH